MNSTGTSTCAASKTVVTPTCASAHPHVYGLHVADLWQTALDTYGMTDVITIPEIIKWNRLLSFRRRRHYKYPTTVIPQPAASSLPAWSGPAPSPRPSKRTPMKWPRLAWWASNSGPSGNPRSGSGKTGPPSSCNYLERCHRFHCDSYDASKYANTCKV